MGGKKWFLPKTIAMYLPQFHETMDNNLWWGNGFTEWTAVKKAEKLIPHHIQPKVPLNKNYYNLLDKKTMKWQADLADKYGIYGFCFYHYYFKDGKMELQLPAENLLKWKDVSMKFCFDWANPPWVRTWSKFTGEVWTEKFDSGREKTNAVLVEQDYGDEGEWKKHFEYLLPFFMDDRYIKIDGKPIFVFHNPIQCNCLDEMIDCWRELAKNAGLEGIFVIGSNVYKRSLDASLLYEPAYTFHQFMREDIAREINSVRCYEYSEFWDQILKNIPFYGVKTYYCALSGYDTTPRRGVLGDVLINNSPAIFKEKYFELLKKSIRDKNEYIFLNAWNEWGEGMYIEPDEENGYKYLEAIRDAQNNILDTKDEYFYSNDVSGNFGAEIEQLRSENEKNRYLWQILTKWLDLLEEDKLQVSNVLKKEKVCSVAIYGMGIIGRHLLKRLQKENVNVVFAIDRSVRKFGDIEIYRPESEGFPHADMIIVTAYNSEKIIKSLHEKFSGKIMCLSDILQVL